MKKFVFSIFIVFLVLGIGHAANFYWKATYSDLNAISGLSDGDRGVVIDNTGVVTFYYHSGGAWVKTSAIVTGQGSSGGTLTLQEAAANGTEYRAMRAPDSLSDNVTFVLPSAAPSSGQSWSFAAPSGGTSQISWADYATVDRTKTFSFVVDNVVATDNVLMWRVPVAITVTRADCYVTVDNVVGTLMGCATDNVTSCSAIDSSWTVTNAVNPFSDTSISSPNISAGAWIRWSTTSVGTASANRLSCTVQYHE